MPITGKQYVGRLNLVSEAQEQDLSPITVLTRDDNGDVKLTPVSFFATVVDLDNKADLVEGKVPASQLPSYVDDVLEYANLGAFPVTGESGKIYVALDTNKTYRWSGTVYVEISPSLALGETSSTAYRGDRGKIAYDHSQTTGNPHNTQIGDISGLQTALNEKAIDADVLHKNIDETINSNKVFAIDKTLLFGTKFQLTNRSDFGGLALGVDGVSSNIIFVNATNGFIGFDKLNPQALLDVNGVIKAFPAENNDEVVTLLQLLDLNENNVKLSGFTSQQLSGALILDALNTIELRTANAIFTPIATPTYEQGKLEYDSNTQALVFYNDDSSVALNIGQESWIRVRNDSGTSIPNGSAVYISGTHSSGIPQISLASAASITTSIVAGLTTKTIPNNSIGYVTSLGLVNNLNTSGFTAGSILFLSATTPGALTTTVPSAPNYRYRVGLVTKSNSTTGTIHVTPSIAVLDRLSGSAVLDFPSTSAGTSSELTISVTGAADGDIVMLGVPNASTNPNSCFTARVSAANTVTVRFNNYSNATINPASGTFKVTIFK